MAIIDDLLARLRAAGGDTTDIEVKAAAGGLPSSIESTLCALANLPGGGWIILGLDERDGFRPVALADQQALKQGLVGKARSCVPPVTLSFHDAESEGRPLILAEVAECSVSAKPCRVARSGQAWLRAWDGDFAMSALEEQAFMAQRGQPRFDQRMVPGATRQDLDADLVAGWLDVVADRDPRGLGRFDHEERLFRGGVVNADGEPTVAGLLALGVYPQQFFPRLVVNLAVADGAPGVRAREPMTLSGPVPAMLEGAMDWARRVFALDVRADERGSVRDVREYPLEAFREVIANALVHRDLDDWSAGMAVEVRLARDRLIVTNPGGLFGITVDRLGREGTSSARNARLLEVCRYVRSGDGSRVVETLASGIPRVLQTLDEEGHPPPVFSDSGIRFTVILHARETVTAPAAGVAKARALTDTQRALLDVLGAETLSIKQLERMTGVKAPTLRKALRSLAAQGLTEQIGGRGRPTVYRRTVGD